jgi:diguanylate cyclase (GGDEF)-like protein
MMMAYIAHEMGNPLNGMLGFAHLMAADAVDPLSPAQAKRLANILTSGQQLQGLMRDVIDLGRFETGKLTIDLIPVEADRCAANAIAAVSAQAEQAGVTLSFAPATPSPWILADADRLHQCLVNLLTNAVKYNRRDGRLFMRWNPMNDQILPVDDDPATIELLAQILSDVGNLRFAVSGEDALRLARASVPDLILLDAEMPGMSGFLVCEALKADPLLADVPVIFISSHGEPESEVSGFEMGAADFITKPVSPALVLARVRTQLRVKHVADELRRIAATDVLTGIANRRHFDASLERGWRSARRTGDALALLMIDVDHFKLFNDRYGHPTGDACLRSVAQAVAFASLRPTDLVARYGGEEFVVLLPQTPRGGAEHVARGILDAVEALAIPHAASTTTTFVTVSIGVASYDDDSACWTKPSIDLRFTDDARVHCFALDLVQAADRALYAAKWSGRARACAAEIADIDAARPTRDIPRHLPSGTSRNGMRV